MFWKEFGLRGGRLAFLFVFYRLLFSDFDYMILFFKFFFGFCNVDVRMDEIIYIRC